MNDDANPNRAWHVPPAAYLARRSPSFRCAAPRSQYVAMRDGCRLAVDVYVPQSPTTAEGETFPTLAFFTPYYRRFKLRPGGAGEANPNTGKFRDFFVPRGYAVVVVDVRGTGASFGTRDGFRSPRERDDSREIADWIVAQPWSNGLIGATGISYLGAAADFLASTGHTAVKAIAPISSVWDTYADNYFPGGVQLKSLTKVYDELMIGLDHDRRDILKQFSYFNNPDFEGPQPVDEDPDGVLVRDAIRQHLNNFRQTDFMAEFRFREEGLPYDSEYTSASISPYSVAHNIRPDVAILSVSGWFDGAGYMNGAISRYLTKTDNPRHLLLGPWDHGARIDVSPWRRVVEPEFPLLGEVLRFFDTYLMGLDTRLRDEAPVHYFSVHAEEWRAAKSWPPIEAQQSFFLAPDGQLAKAAPSAGEDHQQVDFTLGTGTQTRYERIAGIDSREYYADWQGRTARMLSYTSEPLETAAELAGHGLVELWLSASERDAALFIYLTEVEADGSERYVTEGLLRALHRKEQTAPDAYRTTWPFRSFTRADAAPLHSGVVERIRIPFLPVAWRFSTGSRIRLSIAGADDDHCGQVPHGRPPLLTIFRGGASASRLELPLAYV
ncbi:hydrolase [Bradyrhizobium macuxiense]|uniref:Hydrolase n=1 Tax=Bradyrhizobium macuxiense TaxID=1755647 RepID=A0A109K0U5_9BRAD|nr:CocE/NonD family hydrolase [Bradyrhizobium macuxiense]KWV58673.1 hydrolase [Bradyrhizobium macuxiense]